MPKLSALCLACLLSIVFSLAPAEAGSKKTAQKIAVGVAVTAAVLAAASAANAHEHKDDYDYHHGISGADNAVAACVHKAHRIVNKTPGGLYVRLDNVKSVTPVGSGDFDVILKATGVYTYGRKTSKVWCTVRHDRVVAFRYN